MARSNSAAVVDGASTGQLPQYDCSRPWLTVVRKTRQQLRLRTYIHGSPPTR